MRALRLGGWQQEPQIMEVPQPEPGPGQVVIKVGGAGACHSDLHVMHDCPEGQIPWELPFTLGHENAGWAHEVGKGVTGLEQGQPVAVYGPWGCGACAQCGRGMEIYCEDVAHAYVPGGGGGLGADGGFAEYMLVPDVRFLLPLPEGLTPYHAVRRSLPKLLPGSHALVMGVGGLGHLGVQILKALTAANVIAVDVRPEALELASVCGTDVGICPTTSPPSGFVRRRRAAVRTSSWTWWAWTRRSPWPARQCARWAISRLSVRRAAPCPSASTPCRTRPASSRWSGARDRSSPRC